MINKLVNFAFNLSRPAKQFVQIAVDLFCIIFCFWLAFALRVDGILSDISPKSWAVLLIVAPTTILTYVQLGLYKELVRYMADHVLKVLVYGALISAVLMTLTNIVLTLGLPRSVPIIYFFLIIMITGSARFFIRATYMMLERDRKSPILIYGSLEHSHYLVKALNESDDFFTALVIREQYSTTQTQIDGVKIVNPSNATQYIKKFGIKLAFVTLSDKEPAEQRQIIQMLTQLGLQIRVIPNFLDLISGRIRPLDLPQITLEDLLGRNTVPPNEELLRKTTKDNCVLVTGAGGSIGSELCKEILKQNPKKLILFEMSEAALYRVHESLLELKGLDEKKYQLIPVLGSVLNETLVKKTIVNHGVDCIFHAAAFKHVPIAEDNILETLHNNVFGTEVISEVAGQLGVKHFTLISTDKAVRPTNVMGATKRLSEIVIQTKSQIYGSTRFCAVRFGNVLGSSGSVIPKFEKQIAAGGPVSVTHPEIIRYFMTISEAAQLVIQASSMAKQGEIYLLDMGEPVKILELAKSMIKLHGKVPSFAGDPCDEQRNIKIEFTGLRPGEKLYEELLITGDKLETDHPRIMCEQANFIRFSETEKWLTSLKECCEADEVIKLLRCLPIGYHPEKN